MAQASAKIKALAATLKIDVQERDVTKILGTLRVAGVTEASKAFDDIVVKALKRITAGEPITQASMEKIEASMQKGACPRCSKAMKPVKLADYTEALYCAGECRIVLWKNAPVPASEPVK